MKIISKERNFKAAKPDPQLNGPQAKSALKENLTMLVLFLSVLGTLLTFLGYGVAVGANMAFNLPHESLFQSPFELVQLSVWVITELTSKATEFSFRLKYVELLYDGLFAGGIALFAWLIACSLIKLPKLRRACSNGAYRIRRKFIVAPGPDVPFWLMSLQGICGAVVFVVTMPLLIIGFFYLIFVFVVLMPAVSLIGIAAATNHINEYVVGPKKCHSLRDRNVRLAPATKDKDGEKGATCLSIHVPKDGVVKGREVFSTSSATLIFSSATGITRRVPLRDAIIETIDSETD